MLKYGSGIVNLKDIHIISIELLDFMDLCLTHKDSERPTSISLLSKHPFFFNKELHYL